MSDSATIKDCLVHYDNRHIQLRRDFYCLCAYDKEKFNQGVTRNGKRVKDEPNQECMAKIVRLLETLTDDRRKDWFSRANEAKQKGLQPPPEPKEWPIPLTYSSISQLLYNTYGESIVRNSVAELLARNYIKRRQSSKNSIPEYILNIPVIQAALEKQAQSELSSEVSKSTATTRRRKKVSGVEIDSPGVEIDSQQPEIDTSASDFDTNNKYSNKANDKRDKKENTAHVSDDNAPTHSSSLQETTTPESEETAPPSEQSTKQASAVSDSQKGTANDAQPIASTSKTEQQQSAPTIEQPALIERPAKPVMPPASMKWCAEKMVQVTEAKRGRYYTDKQRPAQLKAARKILAEEITEEQYCASYDDRNNKWWREHNGLLDVTHMAAIPSGQVEMRVVTIWHKIESRIALLEQENSTFNDQKDNMSRKNMVETGSRVPVPQRLTREQLKATEQEAV